MKQLAKISTRFSPICKIDSSFSPAMKLISSLFGCFAILITTSNGFAAVSSTNAPPASPVPATAATEKKPAGQAKSTPAVNSAKPALQTDVSPVLAPTTQPVEIKFDDYMKDLADALKLSDDEKREIQTYYLADGVLLKNVLNNDSLSPLQQVQKVSDMRDVRNAKIEALLQDVDRKRTFFKVEARYRVALTELAADGGLVPAPATPPPASAPASAEKSPAAKTEAK